jgi:hypothetical protein
VSQQLFFDDFLVFWLFVEFLDEIEEIDFIVLGAGAIFGGGRKSAVALM